MPPRVSLIIPAAGEGRRMGESVRKPFLELAGKPIIHITLERFRAIDGIAQVILAVNPADVDDSDELLSRTAPPGVTDIVRGGATRTESVANALEAVAGDTEIVLIHDAVRPFVEREVITGVIDAAVRHGAAIAAVPARDTLKRVEEGFITGAASREGLYLAQTPQGFRREVIEGAYRRRGAGEFTDDAGVVEAAGGKVAVVASTYANFKITTPEDLRLAEALLADRG